MSTVAYKDGVIACDSIMAFNDNVMHGIVKIGKTKHYLFGYAGRVSMMLPMFDWILHVEGQDGMRSPEDFYKKNDKLNTIGDVGSAMLVDVHGSIWTVTCEGMAIPIPRKTYAIGNGYEYALGAFEMGASAAEAIAVAGKLDAFTGGETYTLSLLERDDMIVRPYAKRS